MSGGPGHASSNVSSALARGTVDGDNHGLPFRYLPLPVVSDATSMSKSKLYAEIAAKRFPEPDHIGGRSRWKSTDVAQWLTAQAAAADAEREQRANAGRAKARRMVDARAGAKA